MVLHYILVGCPWSSSPPQDLLSHINVSTVSFLQSLLLLFHYCVFLSQLSELVWKLAEEISLQSASKCFQSFGPPANGNKSNAKKSRFCPNWNLTGTIYHWSIILRRFSFVLNPAKRDENGFFKILLLSSHLLISRHPVQKSKFGAYAVTGYCPFNFNLRQEPRLPTVSFAVELLYVLNRSRCKWPFQILGALTARIGYKSNLDGFDITPQKYFKIKFVSHHQFWVKPLDNLVRASRRI